MRFENRREAGRMLAAKLSHYQGRDDVIVLALPRGGVPVAYEIATRLRAPLDVFLVRKLGVPGREELAMGAIATGGTRVLNSDIIRALDISEATIDAVTAAEQRELVRREQAYRGNRPYPDVKDHVVILVDDGLATGASMRAAVQALRGQQPARIVVAVPVAAPDTYSDFEREVDEIVCVMTPYPFLGVGGWYLDFSQTSDQEVRDLLAQAFKSSLPSD